VIAATRFGKPLPAGGTIGVAAAASPYDSRGEIAPRNRSPNSEECPVVSVPFNPAAKPLMVCLTS